jgi:hypothetical protein
MALVTLEEVVQWLGIDLTGDQRSEDLLNRFIAAASTKVESWCRQGFGSTSEADIHQLTGTGVFYLNRTPVSAVTELIVDSGGVQTTLTSTDYTWLTSSGKVTLLGTYASSVGSALVAYTAGIPGTVPDQVKEATIHIVSMLWYGKGRDAAASQQTAGQFSKTLGVDPVSGLPVSAETLLLDYRRVLGELV